MEVLAWGEGEPVGVSGLDVEFEVAVCPGVERPALRLDGDALNVPDPDVAGSEREVSCGEHHRRAPVTASRGHDDDQWPGGAGENANGVRRRGRPQGAVSHRREAPQSSAE